MLRNGVPVNAPAGADLSDLRKYLLAASATSFTDAGVPDGTWSYEVQSFDTAGNASLPSLPRSVNIDARTPVARLVSPANLARLAGRVTLAAEASDRDLASVRFEVRSDASEPFGVLAVAITPPFLAHLDRDALPPPVVEVRAVATDLSGRSDPSPESIVVLRDEAPAPVTVAALVDAGQVTVGWTDPNPAGLVAGYRVERARWLLSAHGRPAGTASATSTASGTPDATYDQSPGTVWTSATGLPQALTVTLATPTVLRSISATPGNASQTADYLVKVRGVWAKVAAARANGSAVILDPPLEAEAVALQFLTSSRSFVDIAELVLEPEPLLAGPPVADGPLYGPVTYSVAATSPFGSRTVASSEADVFAPTIDTPSVIVPGPTAVVGGWARAGWTVSLLAAVWSARGPLPGPARHRLPW